MPSDDIFFAKVIADSVSEEGVRITTLHLRYPRIIHAELMTHRVFSRNARSSRAVPVKTMLAEVRTNPFIPWHWGKNQKGMQASEECNAPVEIFNSENLHDEENSFGVNTDSHSRESAWRLAAQCAVGFAEAFSDAGYHKQIANRLLEPFMYIDVLVTSTSWANWFSLRDHKDAEPHIADLARLMKIAMEQSAPRLLTKGQWHLPYISEADADAVEDYLEPYPETTHPTIDVLKRLSVARCARISYKPFDGDASVEKELERYWLLVGSTPLHASPAEHQATPDTLLETTLYDNGGHWIGPSQEWDAAELHGNFEGWIQYRKTLPNEYVRDQRAA
ncbi:FAD-dependent thymidylate synthase [Phyllobacterium myrsinacearum]|uniref:Thymidylate synthase ThyX n=1 Tax=Phyllobacterium myrsinacearum TaxID=28101 RepID=A0A839EUL2_9HYPH|nr:FAD-dependent thymidylate synthase [Phyllobacterium myrsinacearum]MBA8881795.1 thymidylate synthase ThyX [Phyllobacterium myrsinacearum]